MYLKHNSLVMDSLYSAVQFRAVQCSVKCIALHCIAMHCIAVYSSVVKKCSFNNDKENGEKMFAHQFKG